MAFASQSCHGSRWGIIIKLYITLLILVAIIDVSYAKRIECEVCEKFLDQFANSLTSDDKSAVTNIDKKLRKACKETKGKESRFCYYIGGLEESATGILGELTKPLSYGLPAQKICEKLNKLDSQICELRYDKTIDFKTVNLSKLKVKDLKKILSDWGEECRGCAEKSDFIKLINELKPKYVKEEL